MSATVVNYSSKITVNFDTMFKIICDFSEQRYTKEAQWNYVPECLKALDKKVPLWVRFSNFVDK
jgi:hypothetical protein